MNNIVTQFVAIALLAVVASGSPPIKITAPSLGFPKSSEQSWGGGSPWFPAAVYEQPPSGCEITQVVLLQRHGARYPISSSGEAIEESVAKIQNATWFNNSNLTFIKDYKYTLGTDILVPFRAQQSYDTGELDYTRYLSLVNESMLPFIRADDSERVVASAGNWSAGFGYASGEKYLPPIAVIISESGNDTLDADMCPGATFPISEIGAWVEVYTPEIVTRLNSEAPGANLTSLDIVNLMTLCPFDTVATEKPSQWCDLYNSAEWASYEYLEDLMYYYWNGYGNELGAVQGVGWVNELLSRLTDEPVQDETQTNHTLDDNPATFPLNRTIYADFTHDTQMISIFSAIGLFEQPAPLDPTQPAANRTWVSSLMVPFTGRFVTEKLQCDSDDKQGAYVRMLVNDALQPLAFCGASGDGLCTLDDFVESHSFARNNGDGLWPLCLE